MRSYLVHSYRMLLRTSMNIWTEEGKQTKLLVFTQHCLFQLIVKLEIARKVPEYVFHMFTSVRSYNDSSWIIYNGLH